VTSTGNVRELQLYAEAANASGLQEPTERSQRSRDLALERGAGIRRQMSSTYGL